MTKPKPRRTRKAEPAPRAANYNPLSMKAVLVRAEGLHAMHLDEINKVNAHLDAHRERISALESAARPWWRRLWT